jgi:hypothetical protein
MKRSLFAVAAIVLLCAPPAARGAILFDARQKTAFGPPYPTSPVTFDVAAVEVVGPPIIPIEILGLSLSDAWFLGIVPGNPVVPLPMDLQARDNGSADIQPRGYGLNGFVDFNLAQAQGPPIFPPGTFNFDVLVDLNRSSNQGPPIRMVSGPPIIPGELNGPPIVPVSFFDVLFDIAVEGKGTAHHQLHFAVGELQPLLFTNISVDRVDFDPSFHVNFGLEYLGGDLADGPLYTMTSSGDFTTAAVPVPGSLTMWGLGVLLWGAFRLRRRGQSGG